MGDDEKRALCDELEAAIIHTAYVMEAELYRARRELLSDNFPYLPQSNKQKCECGVGTINEGKHSHYCPLASKD